MENQNMVKVYISDVKEPYNYERAQAIIDGCLKDKFPDKVVVMLCSKSKDSISLGERYAADRGMNIEYFGKSKFMLYPRIVSRSDFMILFREEDLSDLVTLFECAVKNRTPLQMFDIA